MAHQLIASQCPVPSHFGRRSGTVRHNDVSFSRRPAGLTTAPCWIFERSPLALLLVKRRRQTPSHVRLQLRLSYARGRNRRWRWLQLRRSSSSPSHHSWSGPNPHRGGCRDQHGDQGGELLLRLARPDLWCHPGQHCHCWRWIYLPSRIGIGGQHYWYCRCNPCWSGQPPPAQCRRHSRPVARGRWWWRHERRLPRLVPFSGHRQCC